MSLGRSPPDLWRDVWDPDKCNLQRERCKVTLTEQRLLICVSREDQSKPTRSSTAPTRRFPSLTLSSFFRQQHSDLSSNPSSPAGNESQRFGMSYKVIGKMPLEGKDKMPFDFSEGLLLPKSPRSHQIHLEVLRAVHDYLQQKPKRRNWKVMGVLPSAGGRSVHASADQAAKMSEDVSCSKHQWLDESPPPLHFVLIKRKYRCNCEESYHPRHKLRIRYRPGYTPPSPEERKRLYHKWRRLTASGNGGRRY
ncbi:hypothetical protein CLCR_03102 [Cladophialophora carrionii]|uniref:Uncharacterized protein n=1 Tax=Cladophialophora carrionii TaxID=86049 RepID=A0A1C1D1A0_9EURO|nr:hypothetical protein CLCR_03102 [Cladophialophora carrionii]